MYKGGKRVQNIDEIYKEYFETVYKYLFCLTHNSDISEELTQETFYKAVQKIDTYNGNCKMSVWLCQIAKHLWFNQYKKMRKINYADTEELLNFQENITPEDFIILKENKVNLYKKLQKLEKMSREVVYLRITGELSFKEISEILNKSENWARVTFYRAKQKLKESEKNEGN